MGDFRLRPRIQPPKHCRKRRTWPHRPQPSIRPSKTVFTSTTSYLRLYRSQYFPPSEHISQDFLTYPQLIRRSATDVLSPGFALSRPPPIDQPHPQECDVETQTPMPRRRRPVARMRSRRLRPPYSDRRMAPNSRCLPRADTWRPKKRRWLTWRRCPTDTRPKRSALISRNAFETRTAARKNLHSDQYDSNPDRPENRRSRISDLAALTIASAIVSSS